MTMIKNIVVLNDQGGGIMSVSDMPATLRAQMKHHEPIVCYNFQGSKNNSVFTEDGTCPSLMAMHGHDVHVVCFEPGIMSRDCSAGNRAYMDVCSTLRAQMGDNQPAVCFQQNQRNEVRLVGGGGVTGALAAQPGMKCQNFLCVPIEHPRRTHNE